MYRKLLKNDLKHHFLQTFNLAFFIILSVTFVAVAGQLTVQLNQSIRHLFESAKTPHLLQMHTGEIDSARMQKFVDAHPEIDTYQILEFLNVDNTMLSFNGNSLKDSVYDNGFSVQSPRFDYLLDLTGEHIRAEQGEVYVPLFYQTTGLAKKGDRLNIGDRSLKVAGFVRDSQMNSSLSVSKRFILSEEDYASIRHLGTLEYLIEFRLRDMSKSAEIEAAYTRNNLESNGPPFITYPLFRIVNAFSDGITIITLLLIGLLVIGISMLCIRFTLLAQLEEDYQEFAVLRAIGLPFAELRKLFLGKYLLIAGASTILGFSLSFLIQIPLKKNMTRFFGEAPNRAEAVLTALLLSIAVFFIIALSMNRIADRLRHLSLHPDFDPSEHRVFPGLYRLPRKLHLSLSDLFVRKKIYGTMILVFIFSVFILTLPMSIYSTVSDPSFIHYFGLGIYDVRIDLSQLESKDSEVNRLLKTLNADSSIAKLSILKGKLVDYKTASGTTEKLLVSFGDHDQFPIRYVQGQSPATNWEIALSKLKADELEKKVGDSLNLNIDGKEKQVLISGIFSDLTNGGKTAKAIFDSEGLDTVWITVPIKLTENASVAKFIERYRPLYPFAKFADAQTYLRQIFGNTITMIKTITGIACTASVFLVFLIVTLFIRMIYLKDAGQNALLKSIGFSSRDIRRQYLGETGILLTIGILAGNLLSWIAGDTLGSKILSLLGMHGVRFIKNPVFSYISVPAMLMLAALSAVYFGIRGLQHIHIAQLLKEDL